MLDLNLTLDHSAAGSVRSELSSGNDDMCSSAPPASTFNFFNILNSGPTPAGPDLVTQELFPVSRSGHQEVVRGRKSRRGPRSRSSQYRGVTFYRRTGRWESHIWDNGKQVYLGGFDTALAAARAYDRAAIKFRGVEADINFNLVDYEDDMNQMMNLSKEEFVRVLRRHTTGFSRGCSKHRGVTRHKCGCWEARMGQYRGNKACDEAIIPRNGSNILTNLDVSMYNVQTISKPYNEVRTRGSQACGVDLNLGICSHSQNMTISQENMNDDDINQNARQPSSLAASSGFSSLTIPNPFINFPEHPSTLTTNSCSKYFCAI